MKKDNTYNYDEAIGQNFLDHNSYFDNYTSENAIFNVAYMLLEIYLQI